MKAYPPWRAALERFLEAGFEAGHVIADAWFYDAFGMRVPDKERDSGATCEHAQMEFLSQIQRLRKKLLEDHKIDLVRERHQGWYLVPAGEQTPLACEQGVAAVRKELRRLLTRVVNVDHDRLTDAERKQNADALTGLGRLQALMRRTRQLPFRPAEEKTE